MVEVRKVTVIDLPGTFLHIINDKEKTMTVEGPLVHMIAIDDPKLYRKHIKTNKKGKPMLYAKIFKALYGLFYSTLLLYNNPIANLKAYRFNRNIYYL